MLNQLPKSRKEAKKLDVAHFYTGKPCKHGHIAKRQTKSGACIICKSKRGWKSKKAFDKAFVGPKLPHRFYHIKHESVIAKYDYNPKTGELKLRRGTITIYKDGKTLLDGKTITVARLAWFIVHNEWPPQVFHLSLDKSDNRLCNLAGGTAADRARHMRKYKNNSSKVTGVSWDFRLGLWESCLFVNGDKVVLASTPCFKTAVKARLDGEREYGYQNNSIREAK